MTNPNFSGETPTPAPKYCLDGMYLMLERFKEDDFALMQEMANYQPGNPAAAYMSEVSDQLFRAIPGEQDNHMYVRAELPVASNVILESFRKSNMSLAMRYNTLEYFDKFDMPEGFYEADEGTRLDLLTYLGSTGCENHPEVTVLLERVTYYYDHRGFGSEDLALLVAGMGFTLLRLDCAWTKAREEFVSPNESDAQDEADNFDEESEQDEEYEYDEDDEEHSGEPLRRAAARCAMHAINRPQSGALDNIKHWRGY